MIFTVKTTTFYRALTCGLFVLILLGALVSEADAANWDRQKSDREGQRWEAVIDAWDDRFDAWEKKRGRERRTLFGRDGARDRGREYCNDRGCWSESLFELTFTSANGSAFFEADKARSDIDWVGPQGVYAEVSNGGQSIDYVTADGDRLESSNFGQALLYENAKGSSWESSNFGQSVTFLGSDGEYWESSNFGQVLQERKEDGSIYETSKYDDDIDRY